MMKPAFYRSVWFWLGCFVLVFLVWAWVDSWKTRREVRRDWAIGGSGRGIVALQMDLVRVSDGCIFIQWCGPKLTDPKLMTSYFPVSYRRSGARHGKGMAMPSAHRVEEEKGKGVSVVRDVVEVPMWCVVGLYLMMCGGAVVRRRRRWRRVLLESEREGMEGVDA